MYGIESKPTVVPCTYFEIKAHRRENPGGSLAGGQPSTQMRMLAGEKDGSIQLLQSNRFSRLKKGAHISRWTARKRSPKF